MTDKRMSRTRTWPPWRTQWNLSSYALAILYKSSRAHPQVQQVHNKHTN